MASIIAPLVGMHFRPPAKQVLEALPAGASLTLVPEPTNPYDEKALRVLVALGEVPESQHEALREAVAGTGHDLDAMLAGTDEAVSGDKMHLGYVVDSDSKLCRANGLNGNREVAGFVAEHGLAWVAARVALAFAPDGKPCVVVES